MKGAAKQYATVTVPANHPCQRTHDLEPAKWPAPFEARAHRAVRVNASKGSFVALGPWIFLRGAYAYSFEPWEGFATRDERFVRKTENGDREWEPKKEEHAE